MLVLPPPRVDKFATINMRVNNFIHGKFTDTYVIETFRVLRVELIPEYFFSDNTAYNQRE